MIVHQQITAKYAPYHTVPEFLQGFGTYPPMPSNPQELAGRVSALRREQPHPAFSHLSIIRRMTPSARGRLGVSLTLF